MKTQIAAALLALATASPALAQQIVGPVEVVATFDASKLETPESVAAGLPRP